ncbi:GDYXXLXY domain-containing protein [Halobacillus naozhouensis]|uniref:GDYXXLXY domain-containing protein n=1 Tax=Halobacillus naozhouensis TaxID=554880 RepID=A0ABY8J240_9BACI|nr:GDYXXLXY domain-containing protein [Halobacillus naozhouensis]WFT76132.1 GDYXXLXY domain-containing protein [Halobacillus naozhouensis]
MKRVYFYMIVALQVLFLAGMAFSYYAMDMYGETIRLKTAPVDPRDPFYGDYVTLSYEVEEIPEEKWVGEPPERREVVHLLLSPNETGIYELTKASSHSLAASNDQVIIKAQHQWHNERLNFYNVSIGLNRYYVEENTGRQIERAGGNQEVEIVVAPWGQKKITGIDSLDH